MSDNKDISQVPPASTFGALASLVNQNPLAEDSNESQQPKPDSNEITTNIIDDARKIASDNNHQENGEGDSDPADIQRKMNGINSEFQSESIIPDDEFLARRKSITSGRLADDQANSSTPAIVDPSPNNTAEEPLRSMSESALVDHHDTNNRSSPLPIQKDENSSEENFTNSNTATINDTHQSNDFNETTHFGGTSPKQSTSRVQSGSRKQSPSISGDEKRVESNRPQSPFVGEQAKPSSRMTSPQTTKDDTNILILDQKENYELPSAIISPASRRESTVKSDQEQRSRPTSVVKSKLDGEPSASRPNSNRQSDFSSTNEQSKLIKPGEQLQIPTNDIDNALLNSPPPSPSGVKQVALINPLLGTNLNKTEENNSKSSSEKNLKSSITNDKILDGDVVSSKSRRSSNKSEQQQTNVTDQKATSRKGSNTSEQKSINRQSLADQQKVSSKPSSRKTSSTEQQRIFSRRESEQQINTTRDNEPSSSRRSSSTKQEKLIPITANKDSRRSSTDTDGPRQTSVKQKQERVSSNDKRQSPLQRRSGQKSKTNSNVITDEAVVNPVTVNSAKSGQQNEKRSSTTESDHDQLNSSKSPRVKSSSQQETSHHSDIKQSSSSRATTPTGTDGSSQWTKQVQIPPIHSTDDEIQGTRGVQVRPKSPNVEQIAEHERISASNKKRQATDGQKKQENHQPIHRSTSADSLNHIPIVDDRSLGSTSSNNEFEQKKQKRIKSKKKDVQTNTDRATDSKQPTNEPTPQKALKATKPMSDHLHSKNRRSPTKEQTSTISDPDTQVVRRSVKQSKDSNENKDPVNVNITVFVKNMNGENDDETAGKSIPRPKNEEQSERNKPDKQRLFKSSTDYDRNTQSDTEQIITEKQKKRRRPKRRSCKTQTYEKYFRPDEHPELWPTTRTEKNVQTRMSQLCPRTRSPKKKNPATYLSTDAFKIEEILPKQFPQSQRNITKTSVNAQSVPPQGGKLLILRPSLPFHHTDAVKIQRISLQYSIDLIPNDSTSDRQNKSTTPDNLPSLRSSPSTINNPTNTKEKSIANRNDNRTYQRKNGGAV